MRTILFAGKGGVGKTTTSAATAVRAREMGYETLVISVDPAHSLSDAFDTEVGPRGTTIVDGLYGQELDVQHEMEENWGSMQGYMKDLFSFLDMEDVKASEMAVFPGMEEAASLLNLYEWYEEDDFDLAIIDMAPTGNAMKLLTMPDVMDWYMRRIFPVHRKAMKVARPILRRTVAPPVPEDDVYGEGEEFYSKLAEVRNILTDPERSSVRPVLNPEKMVVQETRRLLTQLNVFDFPVDAAVVNRVLREGSGFPDRMMERQSRYMEEIESSLSPIPTREASRLEREVVGMEALEELADDLWGDEDPTEVFYGEKPMEVVETEEGYDLELRLPFTEKGEVELLQRGDELIVQIGRYRRNVFLPRLLRDHSPGKAKFEEGLLRIPFR